MSKTNTLGKIGKGKRLKGHKWLGNGMACSCGPTGHIEGVRGKSNGRLVKSGHRLRRKGPPSPPPPPRPTRKNPKVKLWAEEMRELPCHYCGGQGGTIDHVVPRSAGGANTLKNCVPACAPCNNFRKSLDYKWFKEIGWKTRPFAQRMCDGERKDGLLICSLQADHSGDCLDRGVRGVVPFTRDA